VIAVLLRWLLPIVAALALTGQAVAAWAAAGVTGEAACCCPSPERCKCPDHDGAPRQAELRRCDGAGAQVAPAVLAAVLPAPPAVAALPAVTRVAPVVFATFPEAAPPPPEKPPF
jgi:hypothetical protein